MKRKILAAVMLIFCCIGTTGCSKGAETVENSSKESNSTKDNASDSLEKIEEFSGELDFDYVYETDCQIEIGQHPRSAYTVDGKYFLEYIDDSGDQLLHTITSLSEALS